MTISLCAGDLKCRTYGALKPNYIAFSTKISRLKALLNDSNVVIF
jgi:hypothetical protein